MSKTIPLTQGRVAIVDDTDFDWLNQWKWYYQKRGYAGRDVRRHGKRLGILMHRIILNALPGQECDHRNGDGLDNRRCNLRLCTHRENIRNQRARLNCSSAFKGVYRDTSRQKWQAYITFGGRRHHLGRFNEEEVAAAAYNAAAREHFGEFARLNPIGETP